MKDWNINIYRGVLTGFNDAFIIDTDKRNEILANCKDDDERIRTEQLIRPILRGRDIKRYGYDWADLWLIATFPSRHYDIEDYPAVKEFLLSFGKERLEQSGKKYDGFSARKKTSNKWFETQDSINYWEDLFEPKIAWIELTDESKFTICENLIPLNTVFFIKGESLCEIISQLNSKLINWYFKHCIGTTSGVGTNRWLKYTVEQIPLTRITNDMLSQHVYSLIASYSVQLDTQIEDIIQTAFGLSPEEKLFIKSQQTQ